MTAMQSSFFLTEVESSPSSFSSHLSFDDIRKAVEINAEDRLDLIFLDLQHLLEDEVSVSPPSLPCSPSSRHTRIADILAELNELARWTNAQNCLNDPGPPIPWLFCHIQLQDWRVTQPKTIALEYTLFLWTVGYLDSSYKTTVSNIAYSERLHRSALVRDFQQFLDTLLSLLSYITSHKSNLPNTSSSASKKPSIAPTITSGVTLDDIQLERILSSRASKQRKWYFMDKCYQPSNQLLSKSMPILPPLRNDRQISSKNKKNSNDLPKVKPSMRAEVFKGIEMALYAGDAFGKLCVHFIMTTSKNNNQCELF